jgi:hypothetical protein
MAQNLDLRRILRRFAAATPIEVGIRRFIDWYQGYYGG